MNDYLQRVSGELAVWRERMQKPPTFFGGLAKTLQVRMNNLIPEKIHGAITTAIKQMTRGVLFSAGFTTGDPKPVESLELTELQVRDTIKFYRNTAAAEGGVSGAGGLLLGLVDFPVWLTLKMKMLFEIARLYGFDTRDFRERLYLLYIFQLTFSSQVGRKAVYERMADWKNESQKLGDIHQFDWRVFQQEYRDYIDLAKIIQLIPGVGAAAGLIVNYRLTKKLGETAMNAYRMRLLRDDLTLALPVNQ
ncbi:MAG TPA: EcsC family protein [Ohtaekwangia sp.]|nr:EcsC family protein [Ohtaekwangia sp.]